MSPRRVARAAARLIGIVVVTSGAFAVLLCGQATLALRGRSTDAWRARVVTTWARLTARCLGLRISATGVPPSPPFLLVTNHLGYLDIVTLAALLPASFVARADLARWPILGRLARSVGTLFTDRTRGADLPRALAAIDRTFAAGRGIVLFPEATSHDGSRVLPFRAGLLDSAARRALPVHHASLAYRTGEGERPAAEVACWWKDMRFLPHLAALCGAEGVEARVAFGRFPVVATDRKTLARELHHEVASGLVAAWATP